MSELDASNLKTGSDNFSVGSSRLILKNLPSGKKTRWNEAKIRAHFSKFGTITDVKLKISKVTGACSYAFLGFTNNESCHAAINKMNGAYIQGVRLQVEECRPLTANKTIIAKKIYLNKFNKDNSTTEVAGNDSQKCEINIDKLIEEQIMDTGRIFLRNLAYSCSEDNLRKLTTPFGPLAEVECIVDRDGKCKGFALCTFMFPEHALAAWKALDGSVFMGRMLHVIAGEEKRKQVDNQIVDDQPCRSAFQRERQKVRKANAHKTSHTWNTLFLGTDAVAETVAENYEVEKRHLLLEEGENSPAVRLAMAETRLIQATRKFLIAKGVRLDAFSKSLEGAKRSKTTILVKNLSVKLNGKEELHKLFSKFGEVKDVILPPEHGICALVEMAFEKDAKRAFETLAYSKKHTGKPLYLEWAPLDTFDEEHPSRAIQRYGYETNFEDALSHINNQKVNGNNTEKHNQTEHPEPSKILVRNVPFQATLREITQLFSTFGELRFIRMPKKIGSECHRGFCFVDYISTGDARRAMEALAHSTHLYGRRLVLEWAKQGETLDELRKRTAKKIVDVGLVRKKTKMRSF